MLSQTRQVQIPIRRSFAGLVTSTLEHGDERDEECGTRFCFGVLRSSSEAARQSASFNTGQDRGLPATRSDDGEANRPFVPEDRREARLARSLEQKGQPAPRVHPESLRAHRHRTWDGARARARDPDTPKSPTFDSPTLHPCQDRPRARTDSAGSVMSTAPFPIQTGVLVSMIDLLPSALGVSAPRLGYALPFLLLLLSCQAGWKRTDSSNLLLDHRWRVPLH